MGGGGMGVAQTHVAQPHDMGAGSATLPGAAGGMKVEGGKGEPTGEDSDEQAEEQVPVLVGGSRQYSSGVLATQVCPQHACWHRSTSGMLALEAGEPSLIDPAHKGPSGIRWPTRN